MCYEQVKIHACDMHYRTRVDEGRQCRTFLVIEMKARVVVGRGEEHPLFRCDPMVDFSYDREVGRI